MADSDAALKILIEFGLNDTQARAAVARIQDISEETKKGGAAGKKILDEDQKGTERLTLGKHELRSGMRLLGHEFGILGGLSSTLRLEGWTRSSDLRRCYASHQGECDPI